MSTGSSFDVMRDLLDHELQDCDGVACGMVDDVELEGEQAPQGRPRVLDVVGRSLEIDQFIPLRQEAADAASAA